MKKDYITPEIEVLQLKLSQDILGDSKWEYTDSPIIENPSSLPTDDDFS